MKFGAAVVAGALVMFASGYMLGYTTAVPDMLRATSLDLEDLSTVPDGTGVDAVIEGEFEVPMTDDTAGGNSDPSEQMVAEEMENLKRMIVPLLTDEEIRRYREEAAKAAQPQDMQSSGPTSPAPADAP